MKKGTLFLLLFTVLLAGLIWYNMYPENPINSNMQFDKLVVNKSKHELQAFSKGTLIKTYPISLGRTSGKKEFEGDQKTPEGVYYIFDKNPNSGYHKNLGISYPNEADKLHAQQIGKPTGGDIKIHGLRNGTGFIGKSHRLFDWTLGCIALTDYELDEIYEHTAIGTPIEIKP